MHWCCGVKVRVSARPDVYSAVAARWAVSRDVGAFSRWSRGREIFANTSELFFVADGSLHVVAMTGSNGEPSGPPRRLFAYENRDYEVHPDGRLLIQEPRRPAMPYLRVLRNWSAQRETAEPPKR